MNRAAVADVLFTESIEHTNYYCVETTSICCDEAENATSFSSHDDKGDAASYDGRSTTDYDCR